MPAGSSKKRERQYEHIKESQEERGTSEGRAKEIAARTVNKQRARSGESKSASRTSGFPSMEFRLQGVGAAVSINQFQSRPPCGESL